MAIALKHLVRQTMLSNLNHSNTESSFFLKNALCLPKKKSKISWLTQKRKEIEHEITQWYE